MAELKEALNAAGLNAEQVEAAYDNMDCESSCACQLFCITKVVVEGD